MNALTHRRRARRTLTCTWVFVATIGAGSEVVGSLAAGAVPGILPWPRRAPLCALASAHGPRITAIYVSTQHTGGRPVVIVDTLAAGIRDRSVTGELCYEARHDPAEPGCVVIATTHGRRVGAGVWWLRFRTPVYERYQISSSSSHALVWPYWFGVSVPARTGSAKGSRAGTLHAVQP
jgi:hypothetical protein